MLLGLKAGAVRVVSGLPLQPNPWHLLFSGHGGIGRSHGGGEGDGSKLLGAHFHAFLSPWAPIRLVLRHIFGVESAIVLRIWRVLGADLDASATERLSAQASTSFEPEIFGRKAGKRGGSGAGGPSRPHQWLSVTFPAFTLI